MSQHPLPAPANPTLRQAIWYNNNYPINPGGPTPVTIDKNTNPQPLMILVAWPYRSGTNDGPALIEANMRAMNDAALRLFRAGHICITGQAHGFHLTEQAGSHQTGDAPF